MSVSVSLMETHAPCLKIIGVTMNASCLRRFTQSSGSRSRFIAESSPLVMCVT